MSVARVVANTAEEWISNKGWLKSAKRRSVRKPLRSTSLTLTWKISGLQPKSNIVGSKWALWPTGDCADRCKYLINKRWRRKGPGGPTGLQNVRGTSCRVM